MIDEFSSAGWFLAGVIGLAILQRRLHYEIQAVLYLLTRRIDLTFTIFAILFLPGVLIHEASHYLMARLLKVQVGKFSLIPQPNPDNLNLFFANEPKISFITSRDLIQGSGPSGSQHPKRCSFFGNKYIDFILGT